MRPWKWEVWPWNWRKVRKAEISKLDRDLFERYGEAVIVNILAGADPGTDELVRAFLHEEDKIRARDWLIECRDSQHRREQRLETIEIGVVALITVEILLSLIFGAIGIYEGLKQGKALDHMDRSMADTAATMQIVRDQLKSFAGEQTKTREILQKQEDARLAQLAKKPKLALYVGHVRLDKLRGALTPHYETDTSATYDFVLQNVGDAAANKIYFRALLPPDLFLTGTAPNVPANDLPDRPVHAWVWFYPEPLTPKGYVEISITFVFPKGHAPFQVPFNTDSLEIASETPLGVLTVTPRKPQS